MNNKNLVALSSEELKNISGGVNKEALGDAVEYGTAAFSTVALNVLAKIFTISVHNSALGVRPSCGIKKILKSFAFYIPGHDTFFGLAEILGGMCHEGYIKRVFWNTIDITVDVGGAVGGWFAGRAIGKALRKKLGL